MISTFTVRTAPIEEVVSTGRHDLAAVDASFAESMTATLGAEIMRELTWTFDQADRRVRITR